MKSGASPAFTIAPRMTMITAARGLPCVWSDPPVAMERIWKRKPIEPMERYSRANGKGCNHGRGKDRDGECLTQVQMSLLRAPSAYADRDERGGARPKEAVDCHREERQGKHRCSQESWSMEQQAGKKKKPVDHPRQG